MIEEQWRKLQNGSDIRGVALEGVEGERINLTPHIAEKIACAFCIWLSKKTGKLLQNIRISVGHDSRLSAHALTEGVINGMTGLGCDVYDFGLASTPAMFMSTVLHGYQYDGAVMLTASHLPFNRNGLKFFTRDGGLEKSDITSLLETAECSQFLLGETKRSVHKVDFISVYAAHLVDKIRKDCNDIEDYMKPLKGLHIIVDAGNGAGGFFAEKVLLPLGADTSGSQFLDPDGTFPNHIPNPEDKEAIESIQKAVLDNKADFGIVFDTDVDRAGAVDKNGKEINRNRIIALMASIVLEEHPGTVVVTDSITSDELKVFIEEKLGGIHHRFKRGYKNVINEAVRLNNEGRESHLAIETSGHGALKENYFLDDGAYLISKVLIKIARLKKEGKTIDVLLDDLKEPVEATEFRLNILEKDFTVYGNYIIDQLKGYAEKSEGWIVATDNYEGIRVSFNKNNGNGWFLLRLSLHDPLMPLNIESREPGGIKTILSELIKFLSMYPEIDVKTIWNYLEGCC
ncbi:phosphomannomutase/phosphoglucomutase [Petroclostridium sp. X23]|uniref:phosphomannomutase/phosphoglucomutase n=1 Tax=Petroclostridium sp. X23 TaxID=3045146 RepID=UPI0024AE3A1B|nr:phosphomannomutase/phosphoglucomutase [Petroclostridium sp. X23]WHH60300.1 phosphomannomutase/phosphoglucomutase [Petroclostridium sp. X23]